MIDTRRAFCKRVTKTTCGLLAVACLPRDSHAGGCKSATGIFAVGEVIPDQHLGDCEMKLLTIYPARGW